MPPKRGLSLEEKRTKLLEVFHETKDVFVLKVWGAQLLESIDQDVEKLGSKKGIVSQSIQEVLQSLCDDDLVHKEKIGASNFFWSFPGEAVAKLDAANHSAQEHEEASKKEEEVLRAELNTALAAQPDAEKLAPKLREMKELEARQESAQKALKQYADCDPDHFRALHNIECLRGYLKKVNEGRGDDINDFFREQGVRDMDWLD